MTQITLKPIRQQTTVTLLASLTDNGVKIDWSDLSVVKAYIYSESQRVVAGPCTVQVDGEDPTILRCVYDASKPQYLGTQKLVIYCEYEGQKNTYDKEAFVFVASTAATTDDGTTVGEDTTDVDITVEDVSSSILSGAIKAALDAAEFADETAESVQERADQDHTRAEEDHSTAASDHTRAAADHTVAAADHTQAAADHSLASADHVQSGLDHTQAAADHGVAVSDHGQAGQDHTRAESDHDTAVSDHGQAGQDHTRAESDHTQAAADHTLAGTDHSTAAADHTQAASDHTAAAADHTLAAADHSTAAADHTQALADHQVMQGYDTRLTNVEGEVSQLGQNVNGINDSEATNPGTASSYWKNNNGIIGYASSGMGLHRADYFNVKEGHQLELATTLGAADVDAAYFCNDAGEIIQTITRSSGSSFSGNVPLGATRIYINYLSTYTVSVDGINEQIDSINEQIDSINEQIDSIDFEIYGEEHSFEQTIEITTGGYSAYALASQLKQGYILTELIISNNAVVWLGTTQSASLNISSASLPYTFGNDYNYIMASEPCVVTLKYRDDSGLPDKKGLIEKVTELQEEVAEIENKHVDVYLPNKLYAVVGDTLQVFFHSIVAAINLAEYDIYAQCSKGKTYPRYFSYTPASEDVGTTTLTIYVKNRSNKILGQASCDLVTVAAPVSPNSLKSIFTFGDSLTAPGIWVGEAKRRLVGNSAYDSIEGNGLSNLSFFGYMSKTIHEQPVNFYGVGGWTWLDYITKSTGGAFRFYVSGVNQLSIGAVYTNNGYSYTIQEINITGDSGNIRCTTSANTNVPSTSGILTKTSGDGDATITFDSFETENLNPLWDDVNNKMSFIPYVQDCGANTIDAVYVLLSWNSQASWREYSVDDVTGHIANAKIFARTLHAEYPSAKLFIMGLQMPSDTGGLGANYGASGGYIDGYGLKQCALNYNMALQDLCNLDEFSSYCEFVAVAPQFDSHYNMPYSNVKVNIRNAVTEILGTNGVHPSEQGYNQIADAVYRSIVANYCH